MKIKYYKKRTSIYCCNAATILLAIF